MMTDDRIKQLRALCEAATDGPWDSARDGVWRWYGDNSECVAGHLTNPMAPDAAFIAAARTALPEALDDVERLRAQVDEQGKAIGRMLDLPPPPRPPPSFLAIPAEHPDAKLIRIANAERDDAHEAVANSRKLRLHQVARVEAERDEARRLAVRMSDWSLARHSVPTDTIEQVEAYREALS